MVESTALEMRRAREGTQGSNPCLSATHHANYSQAGWPNDNLRKAGTYSDEVGNNAITVQRILRLFRPYPRACSLTAMR